jgi:nitrogen regulatory protein PII
MFLEGKRIGTQKWVEGVYRGVRFRQDSVPTVKMEVVVPDHLAATAIATIIKTDSTVCADDGDVLISSVETPSLVRSETKNHVA